MITLNNSNIDFDINNQILESKYSITLSQNTSNFIFKTNDIERMTIMNNGNIGIGKTTTNYKLDINGIINASTFYINGIEIPTYVRNTSDYVETTSNILIGSIGNTSNYIDFTSNILITSIQDTSNYIEMTSNIFINRINYISNLLQITSNFLISNISDTSNYIGITSNILVGYISDTSNYTGLTSNILIGRINDTSNNVRTTSNILIGLISDTINYVETVSNILIGRIRDTSNYTGTVSNILIGCIRDTSNYVGTTSNILIGLLNDTNNYVRTTNNLFTSNISDTSNYVETIRSNILIGRISIRDASNYVGTTSNILVVHISDTSNYVGMTSNFLFVRINDTSNLIQRISNINDITSNYVGYTSNILASHINDTSNYVRTTSNLFTSNISDTSNYVGTTSNILVIRISDTSNYIQKTNNILVDSINDTSNYVGYTSNILIWHISYTNNLIQQTSNLFINNISVTSNYIETTSNILINYISDTSNLIQRASNLFINNINDTSNYVGTTSNILINHISDTSNLIQRASNLFINNISDTSNYVGTTSNILVGRINDTSNLIHYTSNIFIRDIHNTSNYVGQTSNILVGCISDTSNYMQITSNILVKTINNIPNKWITNNNNIYFNTSNVGIGTYNPISKLHLYDNTYLNTEAIIQNNLNTQIISEIISNPVAPDSGFITGTSERFMAFNNNSTFTIPTGGLNCDILMIGGGGKGFHAGGGAGTCIVAVNQLLPAGFCSVVVGAGGIYAETVGGDSIITVASSERYRAKGGGAGGSRFSNGYSGGCGGGASGGSDGSGVGGTRRDYFTGGIPVSLNVVNGIQNISPTITSSYAVLGNAGGPGTSDQYGNMKASGGGGGIGGAGYTDNDGRPRAGDGLYQITLTGATTPIHFGKYFTSQNLGIYEASIGEYYIGGGGAGRYDNDITTGLSNSQLQSGGLGSKGGWGSGGENGGSYSGEGSRGIVIIRYRLPPSQSVINMSSIELVNGTRFDSNVDYSIGNYDGIFKILSSLNQLTPTENLVILANGNVGIGIAEPKYPLHVSSIAISSEDRSYIQNGNNPWTQQQRSVGAQVIPASAKFNGNIWVNECYINSDIRIKDDIQDINDNSALQKILSIEPKTYKYIDKVEKGYKKEYGFVAQQIQNVLPDAVILEKSYIPNIMLIASYNKKIITLPHKPINVILKLKDKIKCIDSNDISIDVEVYKIINELTFEIKDLDKEFANNKIFVYGTYVDDFQILSKNHIFTLNVGATQELYRQIKEQEDIINSQEERMNILEEKNAILNKNFENLLKDIELINQQLE